VGVLSEIGLQLVVGSSPPVVLTKKDTLKNYLPLLMKKERHRHLLAFPMSHCHTD
jgi:hypothetical protein